MDYKDKVIKLLMSKELTEEQKSKLLDIFPELIEKSEDERIRKALITFFQRFPYERIDVAGTNAKEAIAWLEKQKVLTTEEDLQGKEDVLWCIKQAKKHAKDENEMGNVWYAERWLKSLKERYTWKPSDEQMDALEAAIVDSISSIQKHSLELLYNELKKL